MTADQELANAIEAIDRAISHVDPGSGVIRLMTTIRGDITNVRTFNLSQPTTEIPSEGPPS